VSAARPWLVLRESNASQNPKGPVVEGETARRTVVTVKVSWLIADTNPVRYSGCEVERETPAQATPTFSLVAKVLIDDVTVFTVDQVQQQSAHSSIACGVLFLASRRPKSSS